MESIKKWTKEQWKEAAVAVAFTLVLFTLFYITVYIFH